MAILDHRGNPIQQRTLREPQTARVASLRSEFAGHPSRGLTPARLASILEQAEQGDLIRQAELGCDIEEKDGHVHAELSKRRRALLGPRWAIEPPRRASRSEKVAAEALTELIYSMPDLEGVILGMADGIGHGFACLEIEGWRREGRTWLPGPIEHRPQAWFTTPPTQLDELRLRSGSVEGEPLQPFGWIVHHHKARPGYVGRAGLFRILAWPFLFKNYSVRDLAEFLEIYGLPLRLGYYPQGASDEEKGTLLRAVVSIGHAAAGVMPEGMRMEFQEAAKGASDPFMAMVDWCERTQSKAILGQTLSAEAASTGLGSGVATLQGEVRQDILVSDLREVASTLTRDLLWPIATLNGLYVDPARAPRWVFDTEEPEDLKLYSEAIPRLVDAGVEIPASWVRERLRIPAPQAGEPILRRAAPGAQGLLRADLQTAALRSGTTKDSVSRALADQLSREAADAHDDWLGHIRAIVQSAPSLEALRDQLLASYGDLPTDRLADVMRLAFAAASLAGRYDVATGAGLVEP